MLREGGTFWYTILRGLWDFGYQLELNQEKQQKHLEQVSFTQKKKIHREAWGVISLRKTFI